MKSKFRWLQICSIAILDKFPLPKQKSILQALKGSQWLFTLDPLAGFTQVEVEPKEREKLAFWMHWGLWRFVRMPFGYKNGPSIFQCIMQNVLAPFLWMFTLVYIDNIIIFSLTLEDHTYIPFYAWIAGPLFHLLKGSIKWEWTKVHSEDFKLCKQVLVNALVHGYTKPGSPYRLYLDACDFRLATILQQVQRMQLKDLKGMKAYEHCGKAFEAEQPIPSLVVQIRQQCSQKWKLG